MEWALRWFDTLDDLALASHAWLTRRAARPLVATLFAAALLAVIVIL
jgi:hypothetical protein